MMRRPWLLLLLLSLFFSACQPVTPADSQTATPVTGLTEAPSATVMPAITAGNFIVPREALKGVGVRVWHPYFGSEASLFESQVAQFNKENEWGIVVTAVGKGNFNELFLQTDAALTVTNYPHVIVALPEHALRWRAKVVDLSPYISDSDYGIPALDRSDFSNAVWTQDEVDGTRYGVPFQRTARFLLYNQTWARELGFDSAPATPSEFEQQSCAAHQALRADADTGNDSLGGWLVDDDAMTALSWMLAFGGGAQNGQSYRFLTPENIAAFRFLKIMQQNGCAFVPSAEVSKHERFASRQALFSTVSLEELPGQSRAFFAKAGRDEWTVLAFPGEKQSALVVYGSSLVMFQSDDVTQLASWLFMRWMLSPESQARWVRSMGLLPLRSATMDLLADYSRDHPQWAAATNLLPGAATPPKLASWRVVRVMLGDGFGDMFDTIRHPDLTDGQVPLILRQMDVIAQELNQ